MENFNKMKKGFLIMSLCFVFLGQIFAQSVAEIAGNGYPTLQAAVDDAYDNMTGDVTILLTADIEAYTVIKQKAGLNLTIDGNNKAHTITGQIFIDGCNRSTGTETLTITGIIFTGDGTGAGFYDKNFISMPNVKTPTTAPYYHYNTNNYAHNVTVSNCSFNSTSASKDMVGVRVGSKGGGGYNTVVINVEGDNLHSFGQFAAANGTTITNCSATNTKSFINFGDGGNVTNTISNCTFSSSETDSYAVREKGNSASNILLSNNNFTAEKVIWLGEDDAPSGIITVESGTYNGSVYNGMNASGTGEIILTGGTYNQDAGVIEEYCPYGYEAVPNDPDDEHCTVRKLEIARIGTTTYPSLQDALDTAYTMTGDVTIELLKNIEGYSIVHQKAGLNLTIEGGNDTIFGQIIVDGDARAAGTETFTVQNVHFVGDKSSFFSTASDDNAFILIPTLKTSGKPWYNNKYNYAHNITANNCTFTSTSSGIDVVAVRVNSGAGAYNIVINGCTGDNLHSLAQLTGTTGAAFTNCKVPNGDSFINVSGGAGDYVITDCKFISSLADGYGIRDKDGSSVVFTIERDTITADKALVFGKSASESPAPTGRMNVSSGVYEGTVSIIPTASTATFSFTGGTFSEDAVTVQEYCAYGYEAVANDPDDEHCTVRKLEVAQIGTTTYPSLQDALDSAHTMTGNVTIELLKDITGYSIVHQKAGLNLTIEGNDHTLAGQIIVDGDGRSSGTETLTVQNIAFNDDGSNFCSGLDGFIMVPSTKTTGKPYYTGKYNYAHNITISNCSFTSTSLSLDVVGIKATSSATCYNLVVNNTTGDNLHSLAQLTATEGATIDHCSATATGSFVNISGGSAADTISNCTFTGVDPNDGYAVRENSNSSVEITLINNTFEAKNVLQLGKNGGSNASGHINVESGTYKGVLLNDQSATGTATFVFTGGTFDQDSATVAQWCAEGYFAVPNDPSEDLCTVYRMYTLIYDANGGSGTMDTIRVKKDVPEADRTLIVADCEFTPFDAFHTFAIWNTVSDSTGISFNPGDPIVMNSDTVLYAIWKEGATIYYDANGGTGTIPYQSKDFGVDITLSDGAAFSRTDSTLYRWNTAADESGDNYDLGGTYSADVNVTMYAVWRLNLDMTTSATDVVCYGENNGTDTVKIIGGDTPFQLVLSGTALSENDTVKDIMDRTYIFENLKPGDYTVTLTDVLGKDTITGTFTISQPDTLVISSITVPDAPCPLMGEGEYAVSMTTTGGNGGNVIAWGGDAVDVNDLSTIVTSEADDRDRTYTVTVTVTDNKGCVATGSADFSVAPVIADDETSHSNTTMVIASINKDIMYGCDTIIRDFGTPTFNFTNAAITEAILDTVYNNVSTIAPDSVFPVGTTTITWTAVDTCGHIVTAEQNVVIGYLPCPTAIDGKGNEYSTVRVGCYCWMAENLRATVYSDGSNRPIPNVMHYTAPTRAIDYNGNLYDWNAAMDAADGGTNSVADIEAAYAAGESVQGACPAGWHMPTEEEVTNLMSSMSTEDLMAQSVWVPDHGTNASGFNMLPSGAYNSALDRYERKYVSAYFWILTPPTSVYHACEFGAACSTTELIPGSLTMGFSIRCVKDE